MTQARIMMSSLMSNLHTMRHSAAHALAAAISELYPGTKFGVGPVIEDGFFYDVLPPKPITETDLPAIEAKMREIVKRDDPFVRKEMPIDDAVNLFASMKQDLKVELLTDLKEKGTTKVRPEEMQDIGGKPDVASVYETGAFVDLCRGPHVAKSGEIGAFKLTRLAGVYWRGDEKKPQLQRVYGLAFETQKELDAYLIMQEEAKKRDHRKIGKELGLFVFSDLVGPGLPLWTPKGTIIRNLLDEFVWSLRKPYGYQKVTIPHITKKDLYEKSGHWAKFSNELFKITTREGHEYAMKPMNCPHHTQIFASELRSYREMPQRYCETTMVYRDEQSGELSGLSRVLSITQDDAHVFCRENQIETEMFAIWDVIDKFYRTFGFELSVRFSRHDPDHFEKYLGTPEVWQKAEAQIANLLKKRGVASYADGLGEAAMYGPKIDFMSKDSLGRVLQVATIQLDFNQPKNFDLTCMNESGVSEQIVMIHCAIMGSIERFVSTLLEHTAGVLPFWLAPVQIRLATVSKDHVAFARKVLAGLVDAGIRTEMDDMDEKVGKKIRNAAMMKIPWTVVIGAKEAEGGDFTVNVFGQEEDLKIPAAELISRALALANLTGV